MNDPHDSGTPKYSTAQDIYDALCELVQTEEMSILSDMGADVSWDGQNYYYTDKGNVLLDAFNRITDYGNQMWLMELAIAQAKIAANIYSDEVHCVIIDALDNADLAKRIGFKALFVEHMLRGDSKKYAEITEAFVEEARELNRYNNFSMLGAFQRALKACDEPELWVNPYGELHGAVYNKIVRLKLAEYNILIAECRAHLTAYDDFLHGLRVNQALYQQTERQLVVAQSKARELQAAYDGKVRALLAAADRVGLMAELTAELQQSGLGSNNAPLIVATQEDKP